MKKKIIGIMMGCLVFMSACASSQDKTGAVQSDAAQSEENLDHEEVEELESPVAQEAAFDPYTPNLNMPGVDPYEENLFEVFGMDNNFPKPKDSFEQVWVYSTNGGEAIDSKTGDMIQLPVANNLTLEIEPQIYEDYLDQIEEYLIAEYAKQSRGIIWDQSTRFFFKVLMDNGDFIDGELREPLRFTKHSPSDTFELDVVVESVFTDDLGLYDDRNNNTKLKDLPDYPWNIDVVTADGEKIDIGIGDWCERKENRITHENATWERTPQEGDKIKIKGYIYDKEFLRYGSMGLEKYYDAGSVIISEFEFLDN